MSGNSTWWRPRFSLRTLVILVTLVCAYTACWVPTKTSGVRDVYDRVNRTTQGEVVAISPLVLKTDEIYFVTEPVGPDLSIEVQSSRRYYFWFFGYVAKLPYEQEEAVPPDEIWNRAFQRVLVDVESSAK